jgi:hypothetical protein
MGRARGATPGVLIRRPNLGDVQHAKLVRDRIPPLSATGCPTRHIRTSGMIAVAASVALSGVTAPGGG